jgi:hypothetical protein
LAVGLRGVPLDPAAKPGECDDLFDQIADGNLLPDTQIDRLRLIVSVERGEDAFGAVIDVQKLAVAIELASLRSE